MRSGALRLILTAGNEMALVELYHENDDCIAGDDSGSSKFLWEIRLFDAGDWIRLHRCTFGRVLGARTFLLTTAQQSPRELLNEVKAKFYYAIQLANQLAS